MKIAMFIVALCAALGAGSAAARQAPRFIDPDHRVSALLPSERAAVHVVELDAAGPLRDQDGLSDSNLQARKQSDDNPPATPVQASAVPEPSAIALLCCGLLLVLVSSKEHRSAFFSLGNKQDPRAP